jgi:PTH1 family peptidyl-tRNA hydrolase
VSVHPIQLLVGLGNPGEEYAHTRHNAGAWWVARVAAGLDTQLRVEKKFHSMISSIYVAGQNGFLAQPTTFMNHSGQPVREISQFYQIPPEHILVVHDELDFPVGTVRLKQAGGHGGHNGLRDIMQQLQTDKFYRLRLGIGHPGNRSQVHDYVLSRPSVHDFSLICDAIDQSIPILPTLMSGDTEKAMQQLHTVAS